MDTDDYVWCDTPDPAHGIEPSDVFEYRARNEWTPEALPLSHEACDAFWEYWKENGETHKHGFYESTWGAIRAYLEKAATTEDQRASVNEWIPVPDNFGCQQLIKDILPNVHMIDIRIRMDGQYYWFEGDFLKRILPYVKFNMVELDINCKLENHREIEHKCGNDCTHASDCALHNKPAYQNGECDCQTQKIGRSND